MLTHSAPSEQLFASWNPHFTPEWLSERLARHVPSKFSGQIVDPACGAGNLLAAAALHTRASTRSEDGLEFRGTDVSPRAVRDCKITLSQLLPNGNFKVELSDFLRKPIPRSFPNQIAVVMNPPFRGYGEISERKRRQAARQAELRGRFNLGYAFVKRAIVVYRPEKLVSLLPSNWMYSRGSAFRLELDSLNGAWDWEDIGCNAFEGIDAHMGILVWKPKRRRVAKYQARADGVELEEIGIEVRQGVATGYDKLFCDLSRISLPFGKCVVAARGRDVARTSGDHIWMPPKVQKKSDATLFAASVPRSILDGLRARACFLGKRRRLFEYHDPIPDWFYGSIKILLPEIVTGKLRVELDVRGKKLPLHSALAIKVPSKRVGLSISRYLRLNKVQKKLFANAPRLSGGSVRLQVGAVREALLPWLRRRQAQKYDRSLI